MPTAMAPDQPARPADTPDSKRDSPRIIIFGCGGVGSEVIKLLGGHNLTLVDFDTVDISNLNRQFLFTRGDRKQYKAAVAASRTDSRYHIRRIEEVSPRELSQYDVVFCCVDSVISRMELNSLFCRADCSMLIDCGVEGLLCHAKRVDRESSCLYCIRDLYKTDNLPYLCSLTGQSVDGLSAVSVSAESREKALLSLVQKAKERRGAEKQIIRDIVREFNYGTDKPLRTNLFEVTGLFHEIVPNVCAINSICASLAVSLLDGGPDDFLYYDGSGYPFVRRLGIEKDTACFVCSGSGMQWR